MSDRPHPSRVPRYPIAPRPLDSSNRTGEAGIDRFPKERRRVQSGCSLIEHLCFHVQKFGKVKPSYYAPEIGYLGDSLSLNFRTNAVDTGYGKRWLLWILRSETGIGGGVFTH